MNPRSEVNGSAAAPVASIALTLILFGVLLSVRGPRKESVLPPPEPARLRFLPLAEGSAAAAAREIWSPVMFSGAAVRGAGPRPQATTLLRPPTEPPAPTPLFLVAPDGVGAGVPPQAPPEMTPRPIPFERLLLSETVQLDAPAPVRWTRELPEGWAEAAERADAWPDTSAMDSSWEAVVRVVLAPEGWPRHVLVESSSHEGVNAALVRALRTWRFAAAPELREGRVRIRFDPDGPEEEF